MTTSTTITNAANGAIITVTTVHRSAIVSPRVILLGILAVALIVSGLYLLFRKEKSG